ncbi:YwiC-like family protein [Geobacillus sp. PK12]|uniref:YwiC-like family protein n=1 Tax=Geobacillus sp. PK12 TaxID=2508525 RepID=UPI001011A510|nr:YwiC-like family protein [Geobacillus sp. PK12]RXS91934.1 hypothetical protein ETR37_01485 [Geobacillus sp. PK12]
MANKSKWVMPKQHGAWAMLIIPFWLGAYAGGLSRIHAPLFVAWLALYLATYPLLMAVKTKRKEPYVPAAVRYGAIAAPALAVSLWQRPTLVLFGLAMIPFFLVNTYYSKKKNERAFWNDAAAIAAFCIGGLAAFYAGRGALTIKAFELALFSFLFFIGSTFYVKTMIREKKNERYKWLSWGYHALLIVGLIAIGEPFAVLAYAPSVIRAVYLYGKSLPIMKLGMLEIANAAYFFIAMIVLYS